MINTINVCFQYTLDAQLTLKITFSPKPLSYIYIYRILQETLFKMFNL